MQNAFWALIGIVAGFFIGLRTNYMMGRAFEYRAFLHKAVIDVRLMSERLCSTSYDLQKVPRVDSVVRLCADQFEYLGMKHEANALRDVEREIAAKLELAKQSTSDIQLRSEKEAWIQRLESLQPNWLRFSWRRRSSHISGYKRLGIVCSGFWMLLAVMIYFLGIYFHSSFIADSLWRIYGWIPAPAWAQPAKPDPAFYGLGFGLFVFLPVIVGWILLCLIPFSIRWVRDGFQH
jgi:hypothetical protein